MGGIGEGSPRLAAAARGAAVLLGLVAAVSVPSAGAAQGRPVRARDLGIPFEGLPGPLNAITDVAGVEVGHTTLIRGAAGPLVVGDGPVRTGVTALLPRGHTFDPVYGAMYALNGNGEMTGSHWLEESGFLETPVLITNTFSVGLVRDATLAWMDSTGLNPDPEGGFWFAQPVVAETYDVLNDIRGQHVTRADVFQALDSATGGVVAEGNVGGGTGMIAHAFKGGIGTASRIVNTGHTVGVLVQANYGDRERFTVAGVPVGHEISDLRPNYAVMTRGSIIVVVATDAPLLPPQLRRLVERVPLAIGRMGGLGENSSGDIFLAFSTANPAAWTSDTTATLEALPNEWMDPLFAATVEATEEAILNAMVAARTMAGRDSLVVHALPQDRLQEILKKYGRLVEPGSLPVAVDMTAEEMNGLTGTYRGDDPISEARLFERDGMLFLSARGVQRVVRLADGRLLVLGTGGVELEAPPDTPGRLRIRLNDRILATLDRVKKD